MKANVTIVLLVALCAMTIPGFAQSNDVPEVPELEAFHEVIHRIWHDAWPKQDTDLLKKLSPDVEKGVSEVAAAKLPAGLEDRQEEWNEGVTQLQAAGKEYVTASASTDDARLLKAAEVLHERFEVLMHAVTGHEHDGGH